MGNAVPRPAAAAAQQAYIDKPERHLIEDMRKVVLVGRIGKSRFLKTYQCTEDSVPVCVKVYVKLEAEEDLEAVRLELARLQRLVPQSVCLNVLPYSRAVLGRKHGGGRSVTGAAYVVRQHFFSNLLDRLGTRPFLTLVEKQWVGYQLICAVEQCHARGVCHGDIKSENLMVSSWTWVTLVDFASFKPTYLPDDGPEFDYYFAASHATTEAQRARCYLAPERFFSSSSNEEEDVVVDEDGVAQARRDGSRGGALEPSMDVFSVGCVLTEIFNEDAGTVPSLELPTLLRLYRKKDGEEPVVDGSTVPSVAKLENATLRSVVATMLSADPAKRGDIAAHKQRLLEEGAMPAEFRDFVYGFFAELLREAHTPDQRIALVCKRYGPAMERMAGVTDSEGALFFQRLARTLDDHHDPAAEQPTARRKQNDDAILHCPVEELIRRTEALLSDPDNLDEVSDDDDEEASTIDDEEDAAPRQSSTRRADGGSLILMAQLVCVSMRHVRWSRSKLAALALLVRFGAYVDDEARLQRLIPHVVSLLDDDAASVRAAATRALASLVSRVRVFASSDAKLFPKYLFLSMAKLVTDVEETVVVAFAESLGLLAESARRFLEIALANKKKQEKEKDVAAPAPESEAQLEYDTELGLLRSQVERWVVPLLSEASTLAKRALLGELPRLCAFFGREQTQDTLMHHLFTFPNDADWGLRHAFCEHIAAVGAFLGPAATELYIKPCVQEVLVDTEVLVIARALRGLVALSELGLLSRKSTLELCSQEGVSAAPLLLHPSQSVRCAAAALFAAAARTLGRADATALLYEPTLSRYLQRPETMMIDLFFSEEQDDAKLAEAILQGLKPPMSAKAYRQALLSKKKQQKPSLDAKLAKEERNDDSEEEEAMGAVIIDEEDDSSSRTAADDEAAMLLMRDYLEEASQHARHRMATMLQRSAPTSAQQQRRRIISTPTTTAPAKKQAEAPAPLEEEAGGVRVGGIVAEDGRLFSAHAHSLVVPDQKYATLVAAVDAPEYGVPLAASTTTTMTGTVPAPLDDRLRARYGLVDRRGGVGTTRLDLLSDEHHSQLAPPENNPQHSEFASLDNMHAAVRRPPPAPSQQQQEAASSSEQQAASTTPAASAESSPPRPPPPPGESDARPAASSGSMSPTTPSSSGVAKSSKRYTSMLKGLTPNRSSFASPLSHISLPGRRGWGSTSTTTAAAEPPQQQHQEELLPEQPRRKSRSALACRVEALGVPPLPPDLGCLRRQGDDRPFSWYATPPTLEPAEAARRAEWRPKAGVVVATLAEHQGSVGRLSVAQDQSFFVSASTDGTAKVWATKGLDRAVAPRSLATYEAGVPISDVCTLDNSRSVATALASGEVHVWRVDHLSSSTPKGASTTQHNNLSSAQLAEDDEDEELDDMIGGGLRRRSRVASSPARLSTTTSSSSHAALASLCLVRRLRPREEEGAVVTVNHFNTEMSSVVVYGTQRGKLHAADLRMRREAWCLDMPAELGLLTAVALGNDRHWACAGTSEGFVSLFDVRYATLVKLWRHSSQEPIHRLATCARLPLSSAEAAPLAFVAAGDNQVAVWDLGLGGACRQCFRAVAPRKRGEVVPPASNEAAAEERWALPMLEEVATKSHPRDRIFTVASQLTKLERPLLSMARREPTVRAIMGRISAQGNSYLITGGTDCHVRYWDFLSPSRCFTVSGPDPGMPRPTYESPRIKQRDSQAADSRLFVCRDHATPPPEALAPSDTPVLQQRGPVAPPTAHRDAILDLKSIDLPIKMMLSSSRDGVIKCWR